MKNIYLAICTIVFVLTFTACGEKNKDAVTSETPKEKAIMIQPRVEKEGPKSVLILSSSPRRGGNSEALCAQFKKGAEEAGNTVEMININDYSIRYFDQKEYDRSTSAAETDDAAMIIAKMKSMLLCSLHPCISIT